jgi:RHS repeat-associated protein
MRDPAGVLSYYYYDDSGLLFAFDKGGTRYYVATDQLGTPKVITDTTGTVVKQMEFDSFGMWTFDSNPGFDVPVGFAGGIVDTRTTLVRFGYRDYEPGTGRWTAKDPIFFAGGQGNLFGYVQNNPVNRIDPFGLWEIEIGGIKFPLINNFIEPSNEPLSAAEIALDFLPIGSVGKVTKAGKNVCKIGGRGRFKKGADDLEQLVSIEKAQQAVREGKLDKVIDNIEKSVNRLTNRLDKIKSYKDSIDEFN